MVIRLSSVTTETLVLRELSPGEVVSIRLEDGTRLEGRLLIVPRGRDLEFLLQIGLVGDDSTNWMAGPQLLELSLVPRTGDYYTVVVLGDVVVGQPLTIRLFSHQEMTCELGQVVSIA